MEPRKFGWKRDLPHLGHKKYSAHMGDPVSLPPLIDLRSKMSPIEDQGNLGSCVAHGIAACLEFLEMQELRTTRGVEIFQDGEFIPMSRLFIYWNARGIDGDQNADNGTMPSSAIQAIKTLGVCQEPLWPYSQGQVLVPPAALCFSTAAAHDVTASMKLDNDLNQMKSCLASQYPFTFGVSVYDSFMDHQVARTGIVPMPGPTENLQGGHCMACVGYDDSKESFIVRNSWGTSWGQHGYCYIPYAYLTSADLCSDLWTIRVN